MDGNDPVRAVYDLSYRRLVTQMVALCGNLGDAEEVVQESFEATLTHRSDFAQVGNKEAWLRTVAVNLLRNRWRRTRVAARVMPRFRVELSIDLGPGSPEDHIAIVFTRSTSSACRCGSRSCCAMSQISASA